VSQRNLNNYLERVSMGVLVLSEDNKEAFVSYAPSFIFDDISEPGALALGTYDDETSVATGILVALVNRGYLEILWLYVGESYRGQGFAKEMLERLMDVTTQESAISAITVDIDAESDSTEALALLNRCGFDITDSTESVYSLTVGMLADNHFLNDTRKGGVHVVPIQVIQAYTRSAFDKKLMINDVGLPIELPIPWGNYDSKCSVGYIDENELQGILLFTKLDDSLELSFAYVAAGHNAAFASMLHEACLLVTKAYDYDMPVTISALGDVSAAIVEKIFPNINRHKIHRAIRKYR
jgi:ribosomal protein S18 acetylase RimI-like enzyme